MGYRYCWPPRLDDLTARQLKRLQLADAVEADIKRRQREQAENPNSMSHEHYDVSASRADAFGGSE